MILWQVKHVPISDDATWDDEWCWEHKTLEVVVGTDDKSGLVFVQKGFWMHVKSTHAVSAFTLQPHKKRHCTAASGNPCYNQFLDCFQ
jgi:hypothetical protein